MENFCYTYINTRTFAYIKINCVLITIYMCTKSEERCYVYNIFTTNHKWLVVIGLNLKLTLRLLFCPNNNN